MKHLKFNEICTQYGIVLRSYDAGKAIIEALGLLPQCGVSDGFSVRSGAKLLVFYNGRQQHGRIRFTIAHELGHILLGHLDFRADVKEEMPEFAEIEANIFAAVLIANDILHAYGESAA